ncbi:MAG: hypothetical protein ABIQ35_08095 [Verrucomicrobiota bacterium]
MPVALQMTSLQQDGIRSLGITATGTAPAQWTLEYSVDLNVWTPYTNGTGAIDLQVPIGEEPNRFFRLKGQ